MQPAISFAHQKGSRGGGGGGEQPGARARGRREKQERAKEREGEKPKSSFSLFEVLSYAHLILFYQLSLMAS